MAIFDQKFSSVSLVRDDTHVGVLTLNRPDVANAFNTKMGEELLAIFSEFYRDPSACRTLVITGSGDRAFCAGADLKERNGMSDDQWRRQHAIFEQMIRAMIDCPIPIIGAINGAAYAGGLEIALNADFLYAAEHAKFAFTEVKLGIMPGASGTQHLPRAIGLRRAKELILSCRPFTAEEALDWGLVNKMCSAENLLSETLDVARTIAGNAPISVQQARKAVDVAGSLDLKNGYDYEITAYQAVIGTEDRREGIAAFNEKRVPKFKGK